MKIYVLTFDMTLVLTRLKKFRLYDFNSQIPMIFIEASNPDDACHLGYCKLSEILLKQDESVDNAHFIRDIMHDIRVTKVVCNEKKL